uniref:DUF2428 domain-containing protein n=1 Tax=Plectus sambesii TaxID=2011161 RepID=A0A914VXJ6_9BILA
MAESSKEAEETLDYLKKQLGALSQVDRKSKSAAVDSLPISVDSLTTLAEDSLRWLHCETLDCRTRFLAGQVFCRATFLNQRGSKHPVTVRFLSSTPDLWDNSVQALLHGLFLESDVAYFADLCANLGVLIVQFAGQSATEDPFFRIWLLKDFLSACNRNFDADASKFERKLLGELADRARAVLHQYWDYRFSSIIDNVIDCFSLCVRLHSRLGADLEQLLTYYVVRVPWHVKGKYKVLPALLQQVKPTTTVRECEERLTEQLFQCQAYQHTATVTVGVILRMAEKVLECSERKDAQQLWSKLLLDCFTSKHKLRRTSSAHYWLPRIGNQKKFHPLLLALLETIEGNISTSSLSAWPLDTEEVAALTSIDIDWTGDTDETGDGWSLPEGNLWAWVSVFSALSKSQAVPLTDHRFGLLEICLRQRQNDIRLQAFVAVAYMFVQKPLQSINSKLWKYIEDALLINIAIDDAALRSRLLKEVEYLSKWMLSAKSSANQTELARMISEIEGYLRPAANYQRIVTALRLLTIFAPLRASKLEAGYRSQLVGLLNHGASEVRHLAADLLYTQFDFDDALRDGLLQRALLLCRNIKQSDCETAADLCCLLLKAPAASDSIVAQFLALAVDAFESTTKNSVVGEHLDFVPIHGYLFCLATALSSNQTIEFDSALVNRIISLCFKVNQFVLTAVGSSSQGDCPSFPEMQLAIEQQSLLQDIEDVSISEKYSRTLASCWLALKSSCHLLAQVVQCFSLHLDAPTCLSVSDCFVQTLLRIRHKGAVDHCGAAFAQLCRTLSASAHSEVRDIPLQTLDKIKVWFADASVSARNLAFCQLVEAVLMSHRSRIEDLFSFLFRVVDDESGENVVVSVRALKCLKMLVLNSVWANQILPFIGRVFELAVDRFASTHWSIKSAAAHLLSSVICRIMGRRDPSVDAGPGTVALGEFVSLFEAVWKHSLHIVTTVDVKDNRLIAVLSLIQSIIFVDASFVADVALCRDVEVLRTRLSALLLDAYDARLRRLTARCLINLIPISQFAQLKNRLSAFLTDHPSSSNVRDAIFAVFSKMDLSDTLVAKSSESSAFSVYEQKHRSLTSLYTAEMDGQTPTSAEWSDLPSGSASLQALALPLEARALLLLSSNVSSSRIETFHSRLAACSGEQTETKRLAAAHALAIVGGWIVKDSPLSQQQRTDLLVVALRLLQDELAPIRLAMSKISICFCTEFLVPNLCIEKLLSEVRNISTSADWLEMCGAIRSLIAEEDSQNRIADDSLKPLFANESRNVFQENFVIERLLQTLSVEH